MLDSALSSSQTLPRPAALLAGKVMHKRLFPRENAFTYGLYYLGVGLDHFAVLKDGWRFGVNTFGIMSFHAKDHGDRQSRDLKPWITEILNKQGVPYDSSRITLLCMPRVLGYVFNPVSFWFCHDSEGALRAVLAEVNNTFGETHSYLCVHTDRRPLGQDDWLEAQKLFHVSPFLQREGSYRFRFALGDDSIGIWIDYSDANGNKQLLTALTGTWLPYNPHTRRHVFWAYPLVTLKAILLIHWQALKLVAKKIRYVRKPVQKPERVTTSFTLNTPLSQQGNP